MSKSLKGGKKGGGELPEAKKPSSHMLVIILLCLLRKQNINGSRPYHYYLQINGLLKK